MSSMHLLPPNYRTNGRQTETCFSSSPHRATGDSGPNRESEISPQPNPSHRLNWEMFAIWSFVAVSFAALFVAGYVIWAKCHGR
jgi:hypothetical protein